VFWIASSVTQPVFGALGEDVGLRVIGCVGVLMASAFLSLIGVASELWLVFVLLVIGGLGSAALHPIGTTIAGSQATNATLGIGLFTAGGMAGFALGPVVILYVVSTYGSQATVWLAVPGLVLGAAVGLLLPQWEPHPRRPHLEVTQLLLLLQAGGLSRSRTCRMPSRGSPYSGGLVLTGVASGVDVRACSSTSAGLSLNQENGPSRLGSSPSGRVRCATAQLEQEVVGRVEVDVRLRDREASRVRLTLRACHASSGLRRVTAQRVSRG
jgi:MFS family permease